MEERKCKVLNLPMREREFLSLQNRAGGVGANIRTPLRYGRYEITTAGLDPNLQLTGGDPWGTSTFTGLVVPTTPTTTAQNRYLFMLARYSFNGPEMAYIRGLRLYASLFGFANGQGPYELEIVSPMWRFSLGGGNITFHVMTVDRGWRDTRNPSDADSFAFMDSPAPALLYQTATPYTPPNAGRPWGKPIAHDFGTIHDLRNPWRVANSERSLCIPVPCDNDIVVYASVWQHAITGVGGINKPTFSATQAAAASPEDRFWAAMDSVQYGRIAAALIIGEQMGKEEM